MESAILSSASWPNGWRRSLRAAERRLATAESCASGWAGKALTDIPGSSQWFECTFVTHSGAAKLRALGLAAGTLESFGAVSGVIESIPIAPGASDSSADSSVPALAHHCGLVPRDRPRT